jgi:hypothetical protein
MEELSRLNSTYKILKAMEMLSEIIDKSNHKNLILFDRGYPSAELLAILIENKFNFLMRSSRTYSQRNNECN